MNNFLLLLFLFLTQCKSVNQKIDITQKEVNQEIIIRTASDDKMSIITIQFPNSIVLSNNSSIDRDFLTIDYKYNNIPYNRDLNLGLYVMNENGKLKRVRNNKKKTILSKEKRSFIYYSRHFVDSSKSTQQYFRSYITKMHEENKDTLHIGTVSEFKKKYEELFKQLTQGDSISIRYLEGNKISGRTIIPIKW
ncbi:hypothetical protein HN014_16595 [Aquimarina sp. TRL1]|uniref:hypothetical protein n=1 Tax=Aquimarina sp. (strain TRL1) TaxID=2736252 RepID=UPI00158BBB1E|nr:hypothetical protein [Aquimarina sp. TRL1]QKX06463.1 hypothetical protein HN014_16595 [Aquimarina sp. TRL1]